MPNLDPRIFQARQNQARIRLATLLARRAAFETSEVLVLEFSALVEAALDGATRRLTRDLGLYAQRLEQGFQADVRKGVAADSEHLAEEMARVAEETFEAQRVRPPLSGRFARANSGRLSGRLGPALSRIFLPTLDGVVVDLSILDKEARHWKRLNYGAGDIAGENPYKNEALFSAQAPFTIPMGFWIDPSTGKSVKWGAGRGDAYFPFRADRARYPTRGIRGKFFVEAALDHASAEFPAIVQARVKQWVQRSRA